MSDECAFDQFHLEVGPSICSRAGSEHFGDIGMLHEREGLALGLKQCQYLTRILSPLDELEGDLPAHGLQLLGHPNAAHAAFTDFPQQFITANPIAGFLRKMRSEID